MVYTLNCQIGLEDQDAIRNGVKQRFQAQGLFARLVEKPGIAHRNCSLVGKAGQNCPVVSGKSSAVIAEDVNLTDEFLLEDHVDAHAADHAHTDFAEHAVDLGDVDFAVLFPHLR